MINNITDTNSKKQLYKDLHSINKYLNWDNTEKKYSSFIECLKLTSENYTKKYLHSDISTVFSFVINKHTKNCQKKKIK